MDLPMNGISRNTPSEVETFWAAVIFNPKINVRREKFSIDSDIPVLQERS